MNQYQSALSTRYGSQAMRELFSDHNKYKQWRRCWLALAKAQQQLGLDISDAQINQLETHLDDIDLATAAHYEEKFQHDVMAQLYTYADQAPLAKGILHLGATSAFVSDNGELLSQFEAMNILSNKLTDIITQLAKQANSYASMATVGFTHYQHAQPTTLGKRLALYLQDFVSDMDHMMLWIDSLKLRGAKGTTGSQASFLALFDQDHKKVEQLDQLIAQHLNMKETYVITGQTYPRKQDSITLNILSGLAQSAHKFAVDFRLMQHDGIVSEPFGTHQIGSSAMAYKRNPILSEKICGLSRKVMIDALNGPMTAANQWLERSLDDSSNRRLVLAEAFIIVDEILISTLKVIEGMIVYPNKISDQLNQYLPFLATEPLLMAIVNKGGDRQVWHEHIRQQSMQVIQSQQDPVQLIKHLKEIAGFPLSDDEVNHIMQPSQFVGLAQQQTQTYIESIKHYVKESYYD